MSDEKEKELTSAAGTGAARAPDAEVPAGTPSGQTGVSTTDDTGGVSTTDDSGGISSGGGGVGS